MPNTSPEYQAYQLLQKIIVGCTALLLVAVLGLFLSAANKSQERCNDVQGLRAYVLNSTARAIKSLPTISYYREHPDERATALANLQAQLDEFSQPLDCSLL